MARVLSTVQECLSSSAEPNRVIFARCFFLYDTFLKDFNIQKIQMILLIRIHFQIIQKFLTKHLRDGVIKENPLRDSSYSNVQPDQPVDDGHYFS